MDLMKQLKAHFDEEKIDALAKKVGTSKESVEKAVEQILPNIMSSLSQKLSFLDKDGDGNFMDDIKGMFGIKDATPKATEVFENSAEDVTAIVSKEAGIAQDKAQTLLEEVTATATSFLGGLTGKDGFDFNHLISQVKEQGAGALDTLNKKAGGLLSQFDKDGDGSIVDDLQDLGKNIMGGFFGKK